MNEGILLLCKQEGGTVFDRMKDGFETMRMYPYWIFFGLAIFLVIGCSSPNAQHQDAGEAWITFQEIVDRDILLDAAISPCDIEVVVNAVVERGLNGYGKILSIELREDGLIWVKCANGNRAGFSNSEGKWIYSKYGFSGGRS